MQRPEQAVQRAVVAHLRARGAPGMWFCHIPNGGKRGAVEAAIFKALGVVAGAPDLLLIDNGVAFGLELKRFGGRTTPAQQFTLDRMQRAGAHVAVAYGLDEAIHQLEAWGLLRGVVA